MGCSAIATFHRTPGYVTTFDIIDPENPVLLPTLVAIDNGINGTVVQGLYWYLYTNAGRLYIVNISDPANLAISGFAPSFNNRQMFDVAVDNTSNYAYGSNTVGNGLLIFDISNIPFNAGGVVVRENYLYITDFSNISLRVFDISDRVNPIQVGSVGGLIFPVQISIDPNRDFVYVGEFNGDNLWAIDVSDPTNPQVVSNIQIAGTTQPNFGSINYIDTFIYLSSTDGQATIIDIGDPTKMAVICTYGNSVETSFIHNDLWLFPVQGGTPDELAISRLQFNTFYIPCGIIVNGPIKSLTNPSSQFILFNGVPDQNLLADQSYIVANGNVAPKVNTNNLNDIFTVGNYYVIPQDGTLKNLQVSIVLPAGISVTSDPEYTATLCHGTPFFTATTITTTAIFDMSDTNLQIQVVIDDLNEITVNKGEYVALLITQTPFDIGVFPSFAISLILEQ